MASLARPGNKTREAYRRVVSGRNPIPNLKHTSQIEAMRTKRERTLLMLDERTSKRSDTASPLIRSQNDYGVIASIGSTTNSQFSGRSFDIFDKSAICLNGKSIDVITRNSI